MEELLEGLGEAAAPSESPEIAAAAEPAAFDAGGGELGAPEPPLQDQEDSNLDPKAETDRWELGDASGLDFDKELAETVCQLPEAADSPPQPPGAAELDLESAPPDADATQLFVPPPASLEEDRTPLLSPDQLPTPEAPEPEPAAAADATVLQLDVGDLEADIDAFDPLDPDEKQD